MNLHVSKISTNEEMQHCLAIRFKVFVEGQNVPLNEEIDDKDAQSDHYLLIIDNIPAGTARVRFIDDYAKIERVAILDEHQGKGHGRVVMNRILDDLKLRAEINAAKLSSQSYAIPFYEKLGFEVCSDEYYDAGILHKDMKLILK